jgi:hypothetical protein
MLYLIACDTYLRFIGKNIFKQHLEGFLSPTFHLKLFKSLYIHHLPLQEVELLKPKMVAWQYRNYSCHFLGKKKKI